MRMVHNVVWQQIMQYNHKAEQSSNDDFYTVQNKLY